MYKDFLPILNSAVTALRMISLKWRLASSAILKSQLIHYWKFCMLQVSWVLGLSIQFDGSEHPACCPRWAGCCPWGCPPSWSPHSGLWPPSCPRCPHHQWCTASSSAWLWARNGCVPSSSSPQPLMPVQYNQSGLSTRQKSWNTSKICNQGWRGDHNQLHQTNTGSPL